MRRRLAVALLLIGSLAVAAPTSAHPLGNATVSRAVALEVESDAVRVTAVADMAEIPAFAAIEDIDADGDGRTDPNERGGWASARCDEVRAALIVRIDGAAVTMTTASDPALAFPPGVGGLETLRLTCAFAAGVTLASGSEHRLEVVDRTDDGRPGWHEVTIAAGRGTDIVAADVPAASPSQGLSRYPTDLLSAPLDVRAGSASFRLDAAAVPTTPSADVPGRPIADDALASALTGVDGNAPLGALLALAVAMGLGAAHAMSPGHGKALVAASLVGSRGTIGQGLALAATVAASHTIGVLVLGTVVLGAGSVLAPDRVLAWLSLAAGGCVVAVGASLTLRAVRTLRSAWPPSHDHSHPHSHGDRADAHPHRGADAGLRTRGVLALGLFGGLVPSTSAVIVLLLAVTTGRLVLGFGLIVAFGIGMAGVLGGIAVASGLIGRRLCEQAHARRPRAARLSGLVPLASAATVLIAGTAMTIGAVAAVI